MSRGSRSARRQRLQLEEAYAREAIFKAHTLDLLRGGVDRRNPAFVRAFTSAKQASAELDRYLHANSRVELVAQKARTLAQRVEAQAAVGELLDRHRRFLQPDFIAKFDAAEDDLAEKEDQLTDALVALDLDDACDEDAAERGWLNPGDEALLTRWMLGAAPRVSAGFAAEPRSPIPPGPGGTREAARTTPGATSPEPHTRPPSQRAETGAAASRPLDDGGSGPRPGGPRVSPPRDPTGPGRRWPPGAGRPRAGSSDGPGDATRSPPTSPGSPVWLGGMPPLSDAELSVYTGIPTMNGPIYPDATRGA
ncbi:tegument protein UL14 [Equid herpesvirus 6]|uniref:Tegument protein UL14 n=1 Tax=Equid herpesvirus 6 TaxID=173566 RepID=A0A7S9YUR1_9ALPH|nr:tegument protein UL14 [Equid herpesvirus 6]QPI70158.1 tegument protein UL14 [Equid herpesvirus 6]